MATYAFENIPDHLRSAGFGIRPWEADQGVRFCGGGGTSLHCIENGARAWDAGDALYGQEGCWAIYYHLEPYAADGTLRELIWRDIFWKAGRRVPSTAALTYQHRNHVHIALEAGRRLPILAPQEQPPPPPPPYAYEDPLLT